MEARQDAGSSLVEIVVAVGLIGLTALLMATLQTQNRQAMVSTENRSEIAAIRSSIVSGLSCATTASLVFSSGMTPGACAAAGAIVPLYGGGSSPRLIVGGSSSPTKSGRWLLRARCSPGGFVVESAMPRQGAPLSLTSVNPDDFAADPLTRKKVTWASPVKITPDAPLCGGLFATSKPPGKCATTICEFESPALVVKTASLTKVTASGSYHCNPSLLSSSTVYSMTASILHYRGQAVCPAHYLAVGGGADCAVPGPTGQVGVMMQSYPTFSGGKPTGWLADCCSVVGQNTVSPSAVFVTCVPEES